MELMWEVGEIAVVENKNSEVLRNPGIAVRALNQISVRRYTFLL